jgi:elongation factor Ts
MMDVKRALVDASGDPDKAAELLRERGAASADKKLSNEMKEGLVAGRISNDGKVGVLVRLGCQTDFVARNDGFLKLLDDVVNLAFENSVNTPADLLAIKYPDGSGRTVDQVIKELIGGTIKENIGVTGLARYITQTGRVEKYVHHNGKVGALIQIDGSSDDAVKVTAGEIAMHIAAGVPTVALAVDRNGVDPAIVAKEKEAASEGTQGKPANIVEKIVAGKLEKYFQDVALVDQPFVKDDKKRIKDLLAETGKAVSSTISIAKFARFKVGEA